MWSYFYGTRTLKKIVIVRFLKKADFWLSLYLRTKPGRPTHFALGSFSELWSPYNRVASCGPPIKVWTIAPIQYPLRAVNSNPNKHESSVVGSDWPKLKIEFDLFVWKYVVIQTLDINPRIMILFWRNLSKILPFAELRKQLSRAVQSPGQCNAQPFMRGNCDSAHAS